MGTMGVVASVAVGITAANMVGGRPHAEPPQISIPLQRPTSADSNLAITNSTSAESQLASRSADESQAPKAILAACAARNSDTVRQAACTREELEGLEYLDAFPAGWNFESGTEETLAAVKAGNPGAKMFAKCLRLHGARASDDRFPHYARMKACLIGEQEAHNRDN